MYTYRRYDNKVYTCIYRGYYKIIIIVLLMGQGGHRQVHVGMAPLALVLVKSMVKWYYVLCMYYVHTVNTQLLLGNSCCVCL